MTLTPSVPRSNLRATALRVIPKWCPTSPKLKTTGALSKRAVKCAAIVFSICIFFSRRGWELFKSGRAQKCREVSTMLLEAASENEKSERDSATRLIV
jgi:hypothetical protein